MNQTDRKTLELALIIALGEFGSRATTGRLQGACQKIVKFVTRELEKLPPLTDKELEPMAVALVVCLILLVRYNDGLNDTLKG